MSLFHHTHLETNRLNAKKAYNHLSENPDSLVGLLKKLYRSVEYDKSHFV